jgi:hypothetical protein
MWFRGIATGQKLAFCQKPKYESGIPKKRKVFEFGYVYSI